MLPTSNVYINNKPHHRVCYFIFSFMEVFGKKPDNDDQVDRQGYKYVNIMSSLVHTKRFWNSVIRNTENQLE